MAATAAHCIYEAHNGYPGQPPWAMNVAVIAAVMGSLMPGIRRRHGPEAPLSV